MRTYLSYANVMATIAVFIALGGTSYAVATVEGDDVKNSSLTGKDIRKNSIGAVDVDGLAAELTVRQGDPITGTFVSQAVTCPPGDEAVSGGFTSPGGSPPATTTVDAPLLDGDTPVGWQVGIDVPSPATHAATLTPYVVCAS